SVLAEILPANVADVDPNTANNSGLLSFTIECVVPVAVNIKPGSIPNPINLGSNGVTPLAVLTTRAGEYGLPLDFDATTIDPLSARFGNKALVFSETGGAAEAHGRGHPEDSLEKDEKTRDGDIDMVMHFSTPDTGLLPGDTEACVKGRFTSGGQSFKFFGCDSIVIKPSAEGRRARARRLGVLVLVLVLVGRCSSAPVSRGSRTSSAAWASRCPRASSCRRTSRRSRRP